MKTISEQSSLWRTIIFQWMVLVALLGMSTATIKAEQYCSSEIRSNNDKVAYITCQSLGGDQYEFTFQADEAIVSWNKTGSNFYANVNGVAGTQVSNVLVASEDNKTLTWTVESNPKPNFYVGDFFVNFSDGEHKFTIPTDADFSAVCGEPEEDEEAPTDFTASKGTVSFNSVELLLEAVDNSGKVNFEITYGAITKNVNNVSSGTEKSYIVTGLDEQAEYTFSIVCKDAAGNEAANSPLQVIATTTENTNTECAGTSTEASDGSFTDGYTYSFSTTGTDVTVEFELLDNKDGVVAYAWTYNPNFAETAMTNIGGKKFSKTFTDQTLNSTFKVACKFAYAGGMSVTKTYEYTVGANCSDEEPEEDIIAPTDFTLDKGAVLSTSVELKLQASDNSGLVLYTIAYGENTENTSATSGALKSYTVKDLSPNTEYTFTVTVKDAAGNEAANSPLQLVVSTTAGITTAAPTPTVDSDKVISVFSDAYTNITGVNFNPGWGQSTVTSIVQIEDNDTYKMSNLNYQGIDFNQDLDLAAMTHLHVDVWTEDETEFRVYLISKTAPTEKFVALTSFDLGAWKSFDLDLTLYTAQGMILDKVFQFKFEGSGNLGSTPKTVYLDNLYFYDDLGTNTSGLNSGRVELKSTLIGNILTIRAEKNLKQISIYSLTGSKMITENVEQKESSIHVNSLVRGIYLVEIELSNGEKLVQKIIKE